MVFIHPFDDEGVMSGQGTMALEMLADSPDLDALVIPVGGGGLLAGGGELMSSREGTPGTTPRKRHAQRRGAIPRPWGDALEMCVVHSIQ